MVPLVGLEPTRRMSPPDFESGASASFTTAAFLYFLLLLLARVFVKISIDTGIIFTASTIRNFALPKYNTILSVRLQADRGVLWKN